MNDILITSKASGSRRRHIKVAESLRGCHKLVGLANEQLQEAKPDSNEILVVSKDPVLNILVSKKSLRRALLIMDAILKAIEGSGGSVDPGPSANIKDATVRFGIEERLEVKKEQPKEHDLDGKYDFGFNRFNKKTVPSGRLELHLHSRCWIPYCRSTWRDGKKRLEDCLGNIINGLEEMAARTKAHEEEERIKAEQQRVEELRRQEEARLRAEKLARFKDERARVHSLRKQARYWKEAKDLHEFIEVVNQKHLQEHGAIEPGSQFANWVEWANQQADRLDPLKPSPPSILDEKIEEVKDEPRQWRAW